MNDTKSESTEPSKTESKTRGEKISKAVEIASYPLAAAAGGYVFHSAVSDKNYDSLKNKGWLEGEKLTEHKEKIEKYIKEYEKDYKLGLVKDTVNKLKEHHIESSQLLSKRLDELGLNSVMKRYSTLHTNQKLDVVMRGFTAAGIVIGVGLTISNNKDLLDKVNKHAKKSEEKQL